MSEVAHGSDLVQVFTAEEEVQQFVAARLGDLPRVWAYVRVSSAKQEQDGESLEGQRDAILAYCRAHKLAVPVVVQEVASAAKPIINITLPGAPPPVQGEPEVAPRPLLLLLLNVLRDAKAPGLTLIVWKSDRLTRVQAELEFFYRLLADRSVTLISTQEGEQGMYSDADPTRVLLRTILAGFAAYERAVILNRMAMGRKTKQERGGWYAGRAPYGYRLKGADLEIDPEKAPWVRRVLFLRLHLNLPYTGVIAELVTRYGADLRTWYPVRVQRMCQQRELYEGVVITPEGKRVNRPELRIIPADWETWRSSDEARNPIPGDE